MPQSLPLSAAGSRRRWSSRYLVGVQRRAVALVAAPPPPPPPSPLAARCVSLVCQKQQEESCPSSQLQLQQLQPQPRLPASAPAPAPAAIDDDDDDPVLVGGTHSTYFFLFLLADRFLRAARSHWVPLKHILLSATAAQIVVHFRSQLIMRR